jgi:hypothetical protein
MITAIPGLTSGPMILVPTGRQWHGEPVMRWEYADGRPASEVDLDIANAVIKENKRQLKRNSL